MITNNLVTKGLSSTSSNTLVTNGIGFSVFQEIVEASRQIALRWGGSGKKRDRDDRVEEIVVFSKLLFVNNKIPDEPIHGWVRITYDTYRKIVIRAMKTTYAPIKTQVERILIAVKRLKP